MRFDAKEFGGRIRDLRKKQGITQEQLSIMLKLVRTILQKLKREAAAARLSCCRIFRPA